MSLMSVVLSTNDLEYIRRVHEVGTSSSWFSYTIPIKDRVTFHYILSMMDSGNFNGFQRNWFNYLMYTADGVPISHNWVIRVGPSYNAEPNKQAHADVDTLHSRHYSHIKNTSKSMACGQISISFHIYPHSANLKSTQIDGLPTISHAN
jgi:hypothetical protein